MNFDSLYSKVVLEAKKCEVLWFHDSVENGLGHTYPFLSRNLLYVRRATGRRPVKKPKEAVSDGREDKGNNAKQDKAKKIDLLFNVFHHRTFLYNDALLATPRRATRKLTEASSRNTTPDATPKSKKLKLISLEEEDDSSRDSTPAKKTNQSWARKFNSNDKRRMSLSPLSSSDGFGASRPLNRKGRSGQYLSKTKTAETRMFLYLPFMDENGAPAVYVADVAREERRCPFCFHNAMSDSGLVLHCSTCHGEGLVFKAAQSELGELHLSATPRTDIASSQTKAQLENFCFVASSPTALPAVAFVERSARNIALLDRAARRKKARLLEEMGADERDTQRYDLDDKVPIRQYYHSKTKQPMLEGDWDVDSDDDSTDDLWLSQICASLLDEFEDVSENEKLFLKLWNGFIFSHTLIADRSIPWRCLRFIRAHASYLNENDLRQDLVLHLYNLCDNGLLSSLHVVECMEEYDTLARGDGT